MNDKTGKIFILLPTISHFLLSDDVKDGVSRYHALSWTPYCHVITFNDM